MAINPKNEWMKKLQPGDEIFIARGQRWEPEASGIVRSVGRRYVTLEGFDNKVDMEDDYSRAYPDRDTWLAAEKLRHREAKAKEVLREMNGFRKGYNRRLTEEELERLEDLLEYFFPGSIKEVQVCNPEK